MGGDYGGKILLASNNSLGEEILVSSGKMDN